MPKAKLWTAAVAVTLLLCAGAMETLARIAKVKPYRVEQNSYIGWAVSDPVLGWRNRPGKHPAHEGAHELMTMLEDGSRATGTPAGSGPNVLLVGDSFAAGYGIRDNETLAWKLQQRFPRLSIRNFGVPGYGTYQSLLLLDEISRKYPPSIVIYGFLSFHSERNVLTYPMLEAFRAFGGQRFSPPRVEVHDGSLRRYPPFVVTNWPLEEHSSAVTLLHQSELRLRLADHDRQKLEATRLLFQEMNHLITERGGRLLVATLWDGGDPWRETYRQMCADMASIGIEQMNVTYNGDERDPQKLMVGGYGHPSGFINTWWADKLSIWLADRLPARQ